MSTLRLDPDEVSDPDDCAEPRPIVVASLGILAAGVASVEHFYDRYTLPARAKADYVACSNSHATPLLLI